MSLAVETLLHPFGNGVLDINDGKTAFLNAVYHPDISALKGGDLYLQQYFAPSCNELVQAGFSVSPDIPSKYKSYDFVCILLPKNMVEARYLMAHGSRLLRAGGVLVCAADNKAGGTRLKKLMQKFGFDDLYDDARNKARVVWGIANNLDEAELNAAILAGEEKPVLGAEFISQAGIFGWDKIDKGSQILSKYISSDLKGKGADFGCGYGYLSDFILSHCKKIKQFYCIDADYRAVELCRKNISKYECKKEFLWCDLTKPQDKVANLDFIVMNPPFHNGKKTDISIGQSFIESAHKSLRRGGHLWMVANAHLPYEEILKQSSFECNKLHEGQGFKIFCAVK